MKATSLIRSVCIAALFLTTAMPQYGADRFAPGNIWDAAMSSDLEALKVIIEEKGVNVNSRLKDGHTPLHSAAYSCRYKAANYLISKGADVNSQDKAGCTPLHYLIRNLTSMDNIQFGKREYIKMTIDLLLSHGADINKKEKEKGLTPLLMALYNGQVSCSQHLIEKGADVNIADNKGVTPLILTTANGDKATSLLLIKKGANVNSVDSTGDSPLLMAIIMFKDIEVAQAIIDNGASVSIKDKDGKTPLHLAIDVSSEHAILLMESILARGADINARDAKGTTPLALSMEKMNLRHGQFLLQHGADPSLADNAGQTPLHFVLQSRDIEKDIMPAVQLLLNKDCPLNGKGIYGATPLLLAANKNYFNIMSLLIQKGADTGIAQSNGFTPLHVIARTNNIDMARLLIEKGADPFKKDGTGRTSVDYATGKMKEYLSTFTPKQCLSFKLDESMFYRNGPLKLIIAKEKQCTESVTLTSIEILNRNNLNKKSGGKRIKHMQGSIDSETGAFIEIDSEKKWEPLGFIVNYRYRGQDGSEKEGSETFMFYPNQSKRFSY